MQIKDSLISWFFSAIALIYQSGEDAEDSVVSSPPTRPFIVLVEGNVGSGKSSFLDIMASWPGVRVLQEPVDVWRNVGGQNLFNDMISQPHRWTTTFQLFSTLTRTKQSLAASQSSSPVVMIERSLFSERYCFVEMLYEAGTITAGEFALLDRFFNRMTDTLKVDLVVYIRSDPTILQERILARGRKEEEGALSEEYLIDLHRRHEEWLVREKFPLPAPVTIIDGNLELGNFTQQVRDWAGTMF